MALPAAHAWADGAAQLRAVALETHGRHTRLMVGLSRAVSPRTFFLAGPDRFVIDLPDTALALGARSGEGPGAGVVSRYRFAPRPDGASRLVLDLAAPATLERQDLVARRNPGLIFELASSAAIEAPAAAAPLRRTAERKVIVIDAGHGGRDPGAIGVTGVREKDVVLDTAQNLRRALEARGRYRVELTRDSDIFIPLEERVRIARGQNADLFLSLHADANQNSEAVGASVYTLSERGSQRARGMMDAQDWQIDLGDAPRSGLVGQILTDLTQRETSNRSVAFADNLIDSLEGVTPLLRNTHRNAGLFVLLAPDVPAALLEMGFLTNPGDERRLADQRTRTRMADAVANSIDHYFAAPRTYMARA
ncbi:MAG: N-acetylmuramoyl-L-alanine amidase [Caulobacterales bacterium]